MVVQNDARDLNGPGRAAQRVWPPPAPQVPLSPGRRVPAPCQSTSSLTTLEPSHPGWEGGKGPRRGPAGTWVVGGAPPSGWSQTRRVSANLDFRKRHRDPRHLRLRTRLGYAPLRNFGSKSQGAWWDAWVGRTPGGPYADT